MSLIQRGTFLTTASIERKTLRSLLMWSGVPVWPSVTAQRWSSASRPSVAPTSCSSQRYLALPRGCCGLPPGAIFVLKGAWLGPDELVAAQAPYPTALPAGSEDVRVQFRSVETGELLLWGDGPRCERCLPGTAWVPRR